MIARNSPEKPIGVFDSGVGGLSVLREIRRELPGEHLLYVADSGHAPYGDKPRQMIEARSVAIVEFLLNRGAKAVVVACNTATGASVETLRARFTVPIVAMEPAVKPAAESTKSGVIGVLATSGTLGSGNFARLHQRFGAKVEILVQACPPTPCPSPSGTRPRRDIRRAGGLDPVYRVEQPLPFAGRPGVAGVQAETHTGVADEVPQLRDGVEAAGHRMVAAGGVFQIDRDGRLQPVQRLAPAAEPSLHVVGTDVPAVHDHDARSAR